MSRDKMFFAILGALILGGAAFGFFKPKSRVVDYSFAAGAEPTPQRANQRTWLDVGLTREDSIGAGADSNILAPTMMDTDQFGNLFVLDWESSKISQFSPDGVLLQIFRALNPKTEEYLGPTHFDITSAGDVVICYQYDQLIQVFSTQGELVHAVATKKFPYRVSAFPEGDFSLMYALPSSALFERLDTEGTVKTAFGRILDGGIQHPLVLDGWTAVDFRNGRLIFASRMAGFLAAFSNDGDIEFIVETINPSPLPDVVEAANGRQRIVPGTTLNARAVSVDGDRIFVLNEPESYSKNPVIDVYSSSDGSYESSIQLPDQTTHISVSGNTLYTLNSVQVTRWRMDSFGVDVLTKSDRHLDSLPVD